MLKPWLPAGAGRESSGEVGQLWRTAEPHNPKPERQQLNRNAASDLVRLTSKVCARYQKRPCLHKGMQDPHIIVTRGCL